MALTDLPQALPALTENLGRNESAVRSAGGATEAYAWDWSEAPGGLPFFPVLHPPASKTDESMDGGLSPGVSLILGADLVYAPHQAGPVAAALRAAAIAHPQAALLLAHKSRSEATDVSLLRAMAEAGFTAERERAPQRPPCGELKAATATVGAGLTTGASASLVLGAPTVLAVAEAASANGMVSASCKGTCPCHPSGISPEERYSQLLLRHPNVSIYRLHKGIGKR